MAGIKQKTGGYRHTSDFLQWEPINERNKKNEQLSHPHIWGGDESFRPKKKKIYLRGKPARRFQR